MQCGTDELEVEPEAGFGGVVGPGEGATDRELQQSLLNQVLKLHPSHELPWAQGS